MSDRRQTLSKQERLSGKTAISALMSDGKWSRSEHFKICIKDNNLDINRILISVPKRYFKRAVKRNLLKRRIRESYRTQKDTLQSAGKDMLLFYNTGEVLEYAAIRSEIGDILTTIPR